MPKLNDPSIGAAVKRAKAGGVREELADTDHRGLRVRITPAGSATWVLGCRDKEGRARRYGLGRWPDMGVAAARGAARQTRADVGKGVDPILEARKKRAATKNASAGVGTLAAILDVYARQHGATLRSWPECRKRIDSVFARHLTRPLTALTRTELQITADGWKSAQSAAAAVRYIRPVLKWAAGREYAPEDLARLKPPAKVGRRDRVLSRSELAALLPVLRASDRPYGPALHFLLLTLARREELGGARWADVDLKAATWSLPTTKNKQVHVVPLSRQALALLQARRPAGAKPSDLVFANSEGGTLQNWDRESKRIMEASRTTGWTRHDLRRAGATMLGEMGVMPDLIEAALNHVSIRSPLAATYNRSRYRPQVADALQRLADELDRIEAGETNIAHLRANA